MIRGKNRNWLILLLPASLILLSSCNGKIVFADSKALPGKKWELMNVLSFKVPVTDTINGNDILFTFRTGSSYPFRNIFLFVTTSSPDGNFRTDTLNFNLADEKGHWFGKGFGDVHELNLPYKSNVFFPGKGIYKFSIQHGMRVEDLDGVYDVGLRIEKTGNK